MSRARDNSGLDELVLAYLDHCERVQREPANTIGARRRALRSLPLAGTASREDLEVWWASRADKAPGTRIADLALVRGFYRWAMLYEHRTDDPTIRLKAPRSPKRRPRPARRIDVNRLLADETLSAELKRAIALGSHCGLRRFEIATQDWADVDADRGVVRVIGKGNKERLVPIGETSLELLGPPQRTGNIVRPGKPYSPDVLGRRLNRAMASRGVHVTCHQLRHFYGTTALEALGDIRVVQELMGHESIQTTAGYTQPSMDVGRKIAEAIAG